MTDPARFSRADLAAPTWADHRNGTLAAFAERVRTVFYPLMFKVDREACEEILRHATSEISRERDGAVRYRRYRVGAEIDRMSDQHRFAATQPTRRDLEADALALVEHHSTQKIQRLEQDAIAALRERVRIGLARPKR